MGSAWDFAHVEWKQQYDRERHQRIREQRLKQMRSWYQRNRERQLLVKAIERVDPNFRERNKKKCRQWYRYARDCRKRLRRLVEQVPAVASLIINLDDATDGQVRQFHDQLMEDIKHGYRY